MAASVLAQATELFRICGACGLGSQIYKRYRYNCFFSFMAYKFYPLKDQVQFLKVLEDVKRKHSTHFSYQVHLLRKLTKGREQKCFLSGQHIMWLYEIQGVFEKKKNGSLIIVELCCYIFWPRDPES
jgi:hypothetical protein